MSKALLVLMTTTKNTGTKGNDVLLTTLANGIVAVRVSGHYEGEDKVEPDEQSRTRLSRPGGIDLLPSPMTFRKRTMSLDETNQMLRDRYKQGSSNNSNHTTNNNSTNSYTSAATAAADANNSSSRQATGTKNSTAPTGATTTMTAANSNINNSQRFSDADSVLSALCLEVGCLLYSDYGMALNLSPAQLDAVQQILEEQLQSVHKARAIQERRCKSAVATYSDRIVSPPSISSARMGRTNEGKSGKQKK